MTVGLRYPDPDQCSCSTAYIGCHLLIFRYCTSETPSGPREVQHSTWISSIDHRPLPVLRGTGHSHKAHPAPPLTGPSLRSIACQGRHSSRDRTSSNNRLQTYHRHLHISHHPEFTMHLSNFFLMWPPFWIFLRHVNLPLTVPRSRSPHSLKKFAKAKAREG